MDVNWVMIGLAAAATFVFFVRRNMPAFDEANIKNDYDNPLVMDHLQASANHKVKGPYAEKKITIDS